jgi:TRAP-type C4-dicarboxylate transport system permease small subunit
MRKLILYVPLLALLAVALWFAGRAWVRFGAATIPVYGQFAIAGGIFFSLLVGCGLMALMFYSHRHGYDELNEKDRRNDLDQR